MAEQRFNATLDHYGSMLERGRVLIIDYDVTRFHGFDIFRYMLLDHDSMMDCNSYYLPMIAAPMVEQQLVFYFDHCPFLNPNDNFISRRDTQNIEEIDASISGTLGQEHVPITETLIATQFNHVFERENLEGYMLRYRSDPHHVGWEKKLKKIYESDRLFDLVMANHIIRKKNINLVIVASVDMAILLVAQLRREGFTKPIGFLIGSYHYNMVDGTGMLKRLGEIVKLEQVHKYEFGIFQPFAGLDQIRRELEENFKDDEH